MQGGGAATALHGVAVARCGGGWRGVARRGSAVRRRPARSCVAARSCGEVATAGRRGSVAAAVA